MTETTKTNQVKALIDAGETISIGRLPLFSCWHLDPVKKPEPRMLIHMSIGAPNPLLMRRAITLPLYLFQCSAVN